MERHHIDRRFLRRWDRADQLWFGLLAVAMLLRLATVLLALIAMLLRLATVFASTLEWNKLGKPDGLLMSGQLLEVSPLRTIATASDAGMIFPDIGAPLASEADCTCGTDRR